MFKVITPDGTLTLYPDGSQEWLGFATPEALDALQAFGETILRDVAASRFVALFPELCDGDDDVILSA